MNLSKSSFLIAIIFFLSNGCSDSSGSFNDRKLIIASKETVKVKELDLAITNYGCGRQWESEDGKNGIESPFCNLEIKYKDSIINAGKDFKPIFIGDAEIQLDKINPWGTEEDSIPPGGCRIWVKKIIRD
jgi:hypothetical protein